MLERERDGVTRAKLAKKGKLDYNIALPPLSRGRHMCDSVCFSDAPSNFGPKWDAGSTSGFYECSLVLRGPMWDKGETLWVKNVINSFTKIYYFYFSFPFDYQTQPHISIFDHLNCKELNSSGR